MIKHILILLTFFLSNHIFSQKLLTPYEASKYLETTTYANCINFYKKLGKLSGNIQIKTFGNTDAGYPLHLIVFSGNKSFVPSVWEKEN